MDPADLPDLMKTESMSGDSWASSLGVTSGASTSTEPWVSGRTFGGYRLIRSLGAGGFAQVWEAENLLDGRIVALKVLLSRSELSEGARRRFKQEGRLAGSLSHPCSVYVFAAEIIEGRQAIAMEILRGGSLQDRIDRDGALPSQQAVDAILDVVEGLEAAQSHGIIHRDVKPSNCFVADTGRVKIGDFGISRSLGSDSGLTQSGVFVGTLAYASPEQIRGLPLDNRSDLYSVGATLFALLVGHHPFAGRNQAELLAGVLNGKGIGFPPTGPQVARPLQRVVLRSLSTDPARRYPSYDALRSALLPFSSRGHRAPDPVRRFAAYAVDVLCWNAVVFMILFARYGRETLDWILQPTTTMLWVAGGLLAARVLVYSVIEFWWQRTPGKYFFQLSVRGADGGPISLRQSLLRNLSFWTLHEALGWGAALLPPVPLLALLGAAVPCASMRRENGYAGLHELISKTRVRALGHAFIPSALAGPAAMSEASADDPDGPERRGPYRIVDDIWRSGDAALRLASDDLLRRPVWIHEITSTDGRESRSHAPNRPGRLRWLQGGRLEGGRWDAYEAPSGMPLVKLVESKGRFEWVEARRIILQLTDEIAASVAAGDLPESMTLESLWIDSFGHLKVLEFPSTRISGETSISETEPDGSWVDVLRRTTRLVLEGRKEPHAIGEDPSLRVPVPDRARRVLNRMLAEPLDRTGIERLDADLHELCSRPATISRLVRTSHLLLVWSLPGVAAIGAFLGTMESLWHRAPTATGLGDVALSVAAGLNFALVVLGIVALFSLLFAYVFRGGPILRCFGTVVRERDGAPASRAHCLLRGVVAFLPALLVGIPVGVMALLVVSGIGGKSGAEPASELNQGLWRVGSALATQFRRIPVGLEILALVAGSILALVFIAGIVAAIMRPQSGIHDRIVGTRLVPR